MEGGVTGLSKEAVGPLSSVLAADFDLSGLGSTRVGRMGEGVRGRVTAEAGARVAAVERFCAGAVSRQITSQFIDNLQQA